MLVGGLFGYNPLLEYRLPEYSVRYFSVDIDPDTFIVVGTGQALSVDGWVEPRFGMYVTGERLYTDLRVNYRASTYVSRSFRLYTGPELIARADWYPSRLPIGIGTESEASAGLTHEQAPAHWRWSWYPEDSVYDSGYNNNHFGAGADVNLGPAFGRLRDATPVLEALLIGEALVEEKLVAAPMTDSVVQELARALARENKFYYAHDGGKSEKFYCAEIERVLRDAGCIADRLPARAWLRIREVTSLQPLLDDGYWTTGIKLSVRGGVAANWMRSWYDEQGRHGTQSQGSANFSGLSTLSFGYPFTTRLHLSGSVQVRDQPDAGERRRQAESNINLGYLLPDRMLIRAGASLSYSRREGRVTPGYIDEARSVAANLGLRFFVEDRTTLNASVSCNASDSRPTASDSWWHDDELHLNVLLRRYI
jgi:hypothetical protein